MGERGRVLTLAELLALPPETMLAHDESPSIEELRDQPERFYDDVEVGQELPKYVRKHSIVELQRWSITMENTHRLHYDYPQAMNHDRLPGILFHGSWRNSILSCWLKNWTLPAGWLWKARWQVREMVVPGEVTIVWGIVTDRRERGGMGLIEIELGIRNQDGVEGCPGAATVALPLRGGPPIPYPFVPPTE